MELTTQIEGEKTLSYLRNSQEKQASGYRSAFRCRPLWMA